MLKCGLHQYLNTISSGLQSNKYAICTFAVVVFVQDVNAKMATNTDENFFVKIKE